jgi:hypothetical protein
MIRKIVNGQYKKRKQNQQIFKQIGWFFQTDFALQLQDYLMIPLSAPAAKWLFNFSALWLYCSEHSVFIVIALL